MNKLNYLIKERGKGEQHKLKISKRKKTDIKQKLMKQKRRTID